MREHRVVKNKYDIDWLREASKEPIVHCDFCGGSMKIYRRKLNAGMTAVLCWIAANHGTNYIHVAQPELAQIMMKNRDYSKLRFWGLAEPHPGEEHKGEWRATPAGVEFVSQDIVVPSHIFLGSPGNQLHGQEETTIDVISALGDYFDYHELMAGS